MEPAPAPPYLQLWEIEEGLEVGDIVETEIVVGENDWFVVGYLLGCVGNQDPVRRVVNSWSGS